MEKGCPKTICIEHKHPPGCTYMLTVFFTDAGYQMHVLDEWVKKQRGERIKNESPCCLHALTFSDAFLQIK